MDYARIEIDMKQTGNRIKSLCAQRGITVKHIQEKLQIGAFQSVYNWFQGKSLPSLDNMYRLSKLLGVSMDDIIVDSTKSIIFSYKLNDILVDMCYSCA